MEKVSKGTILLVLLLLVLAVVVFGFLLNREKPAEVEVAQPEGIVEEEKPTVKYQVIGASTENRIIEAYTYGTGNTHLLFVGGIHGGYEWNSVLLAYRFIDYLEQYPERIPDEVTVSVIPSANPDGVYKAIGKEGRFALADIPETDSSPGRFNANEVDLNRNFDCKWQPESTWRGNTVSAGSAPFSEPEAVAIRDYVFATDPAAVVFWHSQANAVYASECEAGILPDTLAIMSAYADASGYKAVDSFDAYEVTGDAEGWLASVGIPAITVELATHETIEWDKNLLGIEALFGYYTGTVPVGR